MTLSSLRIASDGAINNAGLKPLPLATRGYLAAEQAVIPIARRGLAARPPLFTQPVVKIKAVGTSVIDPPLAAGVIEVTLPVGAVSDSIVSSRLIGSGFGVTGVIDARMGRRKGVDMDNDFLLLMS